MHTRLVSILAAAFLLGAGALAFSTTNDEGTLSDDGVTTASEEACSPRTSSDHIVSGEGDVDIHVTVHQPSLDQEESVPVILHSHGWAGTRAAAPSGLVSDLVDACFGVVSIDMRGHGDSGGQANVHHPDHEIQDVIKVLDWIEHLDWVDTSDGDIVAGAIGGSYGGGYQLLTAAEDDRLDAIAPDMTWNDLPYALAPSDAIKSVWVDLLYGAGTAQAELAPFIHEAYWTAAATNQVPESAMQSFTESSPKNYADNGEKSIDVPTLLLQGMPDALFNLNQAVWNAQQILDNGQDVRLSTYLGGHVISTDGTIPGEGPFEFGLQPGVAENPCGDNDAMVVGWYEYHLKDASEPDIPSAQIALDDAQSCITFDDVESLYGDTAKGIDEAVAVTQGAPLPSGYAQLGAVEVTPESPASFTLLDVQDGDRDLAGIPTLKATATVAGPGATAYLSIVVDDGNTTRIASSQVTPIRLDGPATDVPIEEELGGIGAALEDGDQVRLQISSWDSQYAHNQERTPGALLLEDLEVTLPTVGGEGS